MLAWRRRVGQLQGPVAVPAPLLVLLVLLVLLELVLLVVLLVLVLLVVLLVVLLAAPHQAPPATQLWYWQGLLLPQHGIVLLGPAAAAAAAAAAGRLAAGPQAGRATRHRPRRCAWPA